MKRWLCLISLLLFLSCKASIGLDSKTTGNGSDNQPGDPGASDSGIPSEEADENSIVTENSSEQPASENPAALTISNLTPPIAGVYIAGDKLEFLITTSGPVIVKGLPRISLVIGAAEVFADYVSGSGSTELTFRYTVQAGLSDSDGIGLKSPLLLNGGSIKNQSESDLQLAFTIPSTLGITVNVAPEFTFNRPIAGDEVGSDAEFDIDYDVTDSDSDASVVLYYRLNSSANCAAAGLSAWTQITTIAQEGSDLLHSWKPPQVSGDYYLCAAVTDGVQTVYQASAVGLKMNLAPVLSITEPKNNNDDEPAGAGTFSLIWSGTDDYNTGTVRIYRHTDPEAGCATGVEIGSGFTLATTSTVIDTVGLATDVYYVCFLISDGLNTTESWSDQLIVYNDSDNFCVWSGYADTDWANAANWLDCTGLPGDTTNESVIIPRARPNMPTLASVKSIDSFAPGRGGGTLTIQSGARLTLKSTTLAVQSSVAIKGATSTCQDCILSGPTGSGDDLNIVNNATLTLESGATVEIRNIQSSWINVGNGTSAGHLVASSLSADPDTWPKFAPIAGTTPYWGGIVVAGAVGTKSSVSFNGARISGTYHYLKNELTFVDHFELKKLDRVILDTNSVKGHSNSAYIEFQSCANAVIAPTWNQVQFVDWFWNGGSTAKNIIMAANCTTPVTLTNPSGFGWGSAWESDPNDVITWPVSTGNTCRWTNGNANNDWHDPQNWENTLGGACNTRTGVPDQFDRIIVPNVGAPLVTKHSIVRSFAADTVPPGGGGTVTVSSGIRLHVIYADEAFQSDVAFQGSSPTCTDCIVIFQQYQPLISGGATLTLKKGINFQVAQAGTSSHLRVGSGTSPGHFVAAGGTQAEQAEWPVLTSLKDTPTGANFRLIVEGMSGSLSSVDINGLKVTEGADTADSFLTFVNYYDITRMDNLILDAEGSDNMMVPYIQLNACATSNVTGAWNNIDFLDAVTSGYNIDVSTCDSAVSVNVNNNSRAQSAAWGSSWESDPAPTDDVIWTP